jgi:RNA polymerase sporulation-specific sigma factor
MNRIMWGIQTKEGTGSKHTNSRKTQIRRNCRSWIRNWKEKFSVWWNGPDEIFYIGGAEVLPPPLSAEEEKTCLFALSFETGKPGPDSMSRDEARNRLIAHNLRLVVYLAKKFENTGVGVEDLISIGSIGLIKGINTFNPDKKIKLATYASRCIENEILMYLRRTNKTKLEVSIDEPLNVDWDGNELLLSDILGTEEDVIYRDMENEAELALLRKAVEKLNPREREIIELRFGLNRRNGKEMTQKEVADILGISQSYISRLEKKIMSRLKKEMLKLE